MSETQHFNQPRLQLMTVAPACLTTNLNQHKPLYSQTAPPPDDVTALERLRVLLGQRAGIRKAILKKPWKQFNRSRLRDVNIELFVLDQFMGGDILPKDESREETVAPPLSEIELALRAAGMNPFRRMSAYLAHEFVKPAAIPAILLQEARHLVKELWPCEQTTAISIVYALIKRVLEFFSQLASMGYQPSTEEDQILTFFKRVLD